MVLKRMVLALAAVAVLGLAGGCETVRTTEGGAVGVNRGSSACSCPRSRSSRARSEAYNQEKSKAQSEGKR